MKIFVSQTRNRGKVVESPVRCVVGGQKSSVLREGGQGGMCSFKNPEAEAKVTGNLRRAGWTQGQGNCCETAESERSQRQRGR